VGTYTSAIHTQGPFYQKLYSNSNFVIQPDGTFYVKTWGGNTNSTAVGYWHLKRGRVSFSFRKVFFNDGNVFDASGPDMDYLWSLSRDHNYIRWYDPDFGLLLFVRNGAPVPKIDYLRALGPFSRAGMVPQRRPERPRLRHVRRHHRRARSRRS
jgi:hypothetical protein